MFVPAKVLSGPDSDPAFPPPPLPPERSGGRLRPPSNRFKTHNRLNLSRVETECDKASLEKDVAGSYGSRNFETTGQFIMTDFRPLNRPFKTITTASVLTMIGILFLAGCASGRDRRPPEKGARGGEASFEGLAAKPVGLLFVSMDNNGDTRVEPAELLTGIDREWERLSLPGATGALAFGQWSTSVLGSQDALPSFIAFDRDLDGVVSQTEFDLYLRQEFSALDTNGDGTLERSELVFRVTRPRQSRKDSQAESRGGTEERRRPPR